MRSSVSTSNLLSDLGPYVNSDGIVTVDQFALAKWGEGNGLLQTGLYYCIKANEGSFTEQDAIKILEITAACKRDGYPMVWRSPYKKNPDDNQNHDDYWGWLAACYFAKSRFPKEFYDFAESKGWLVDIQNPEVPSHNYYFERYIGFKQFVKMATRGCYKAHAVSYLDALVVAGAIIYKSFGALASDSCMRTYCLVSVAQKESLLCMLAGMLWRWRVRKRYGTIGLSFAAYFRSPEHPLARGDWQ